jgi:hypothetical protein
MLEYIVDLRPDTTPTAVDERLQLMLESMLRERKKLSGQELEREVERVFSLLKNTNGRIQGFK